MPRLFGTDGARGVAITELTCELALNIGKAVATKLFSMSVKKPLVLIGKDTRISSDTLEGALVAGITAAGGDVGLLGIIPTPAVAYLVKKYGASAGVMISASHNSVEYNGIKLFSGQGFKLPDSVEDEIEALVYSELKMKSGTELGRVKHYPRGAGDYAEFLRSCIDYKHITGGGEQKLNVLIDCANGSAVRTASDIFAFNRLNCDFTACVPNGLNINDNCCSTHIEKLSETAKHYDVTIAFDGDADRCLALDETGKLIDGDKIIAILSAEMKRRRELKKDTVVVTVMSNLGFRKYMKQKGIHTVCANVGDRYVLEEMQKDGYCLGGEQSGHIIFLDKVTTGDGQLTALKLLELIAKSKAKLSELVKDIEDYPQCLQGIKVSETAKDEWENDSGIKAVIAEAEQALGGDGRILVRSSGTEPLIRVMIEGKDKTAVENWTAKISETVRKRFGV
jgi:phosphoglucosamine mutase